MFATSRRYSASMVRAALEIFLRNRNCYKFLRNVLALPHEKDLIKYFGDLQSPGSLEECTSTVKAVFDKLENMQRYCKILVDEIHIKPSIRHGGGHVIGNNGCKNCTCNHDCSTYGSTSVCCADSASVYTYCRVSVRANSQGN